MSDINLSYFPARLRELRKSHKLTQAQMAARLGIAPASLSYYESGERLPDLRVMDT
ncbi:MAG: helix-turn-helix domain-containing protein, partial [Eubacterium callanderi]